MTMPAQKPGASRQDYATPRKFIWAVETELGPILFDLAAHENNHVVPDYFGPGSPYAEDALEANWTQLPSGLLWLNPPYADIAPWARKALFSGRRIAMLVPASVGSNWYWDYVAPYAQVSCLSPRLSFDGKAPYPKDLILAVYGGGSISHGFRRWVWKQPAKRKRAA
jgi:hypothetical protein